MPHLELIDINTSYEGQRVLGPVDLDVDKGQILGLLGPSGGGKTSLLRVIAGLDRPDSGRVLFNGVEVTHLPPHRRRFGLMFQEFALFPHLNVFENVAFGLRIQKRSRAEIQERVEEMLGLVGLTELAARSVADISGGERQRVALARSLCPRPLLLMLDEPLGALDRALRERLAADLRRIIKAVGVTAIFVTHDQSEAMTVADVIAVLHQGRLLQSGRPEDLYGRPADEFVARFLGQDNILTGVVTAGWIETALGRFPLGKAEMERGPVKLLLRPEGTRLADYPAQAEPGEIIVSGPVLERLFQGRTYHLALETAAGRLSFDLPATPSPPAPGQRAVVALKPLWERLGNG